MLFFSQDVVFIIYPGDLLFQTASFSQPPPPLPSSTRSSGVGAQGTTGQNSDDVKDPLTRLILRVREIYPEMSEDTVFAALLEMKEANGGRLNSGNQGYEDIINYIAAMSDPPPTMRTQTPGATTNNFIPTPSLRFA